MHTTPGQPLGRHPGLSEWTPWERPRQTAARPGRHNPQTPGVSGAQSHLCPPPSSHQVSLLPTLGLSCSGCKVAGRGWRCWVQHYASSGVVQGAVWEERGAPPTAYLVPQERPKPRVPILHFQAARPPFVICVKLVSTGLWPWGTRTMWLGTSPGP